MPVQLSRMNGHLEDPPHPMSDKELSMLAGQLEDVILRLEQLDKFRYAIVLADLQRYFEEAKSFQRARDHYHWESK